MAAGTFMNSYAITSFFISVFLLFPVSAGAKIPFCQDKQPPNIIIIAVDTLRADHLGCYGYYRPTSPHIDRLASEGVLFEQCYSPSAWTLPSFMSMFTGLMPEVHKCTYFRCPPLADSIPTLPEQFKARGYFCGAVVCNGLVGGRYGFYRGFDIYDDYSVFLDVGINSFAETLYDDHRNIGNVVFGDIVTHHTKCLIERADKSGKPLFLFILYYAPHNEYIPPHPYNMLYDPDYQGRVSGYNIKDFKNSPPDGRDLQHVIARYDGEITYVDNQIGEILQKINDISDPNNTITILVSDHGEAFAEHGKMIHGNSAYREEVHVPMIWKWPGVLAKGHRVRAPVSTLDIAKTLKELIPLETLHLLQGESLWPGLSGGNMPEDRPVFSREGDHIAITLNNLRCHFNKGYELYDISKDPREQHKLAESSNSHFLASMKISLEKFQCECTNIHSFYHGKQVKQKVEILPLTEEEKRRLESLGYIGK